jgi:mannose/fructose/N-acetylgalactosamine-specific phosphotransferase system component IIB
MIRQLRIDDRLVHGEVVALWVSNLGVNTIVIADDAYASNPINAMTANLVKPKGVNLYLKKISEALDYINDPSHEKEKIFVVCANAQNALTLVKGCEKITEVNVGAMRHSPGKKQVNLKVFVDEQDMKDLSEIANLGRVIFQQTKPDQKRVTLQEMLNKVK